MITILTTLLGFLGPFLPQVLKFFEQKQTNAHELAVLDIQAKMMVQAHTLKMEEINTNADIAESAALRTPQQSFGVQVLDAAKGQGMSPRTWVPVFWAFALMDWFAGMVRPTITYSVVAFWMAYKYAVYASMQAATGADWANTLRSIWTPDDMGVVLLVLAYWFGQRAVKAVFGGTASTGKSGGG